MSETPIKQRLDESLSSLVDGEIGELELRRLLKASDEEFSGLRDRWVRYQAGSAAIKQELPNVPFQDISASISAAIAEEPSYTGMSVNTTAKKKTLWAGVGRFAIAASVAGAVVLGVQFSPNDVDGGQFAGSTPANPTASPSSSQVPSSFSQGLPADTSVRTVSNEPIQSQKEQKTIIINESTQKQLQQVEDDVNRLMLEHAQNASQNTQQGVLPYVRVPESSENQ